MTIVDGGVTAAEAVAASLCWLARFKNGEDLGRLAGGPVATQLDYWHKPGCRFCDKPVGELLTTYGVGQVSPEAMKAWSSLSRPARAARIREAQEVPWYERLDG